MTPEIRSLAPEAFDALDALDAVVESAPDLRMISLCRIRIRQMIGSATVPESDLERAVRDWPTSQMVSDLERACLAFTEQFVLDVSSIGDDDVAPLLALLDASGVYRFTYALAAVDQIERLRISMPRLLGDVSP